FNIAFEDVLGNYDFDKEGFPVKWENNGIQIYSSLFEGLTPEDINKQGVKLTDLRIKFQNADKFNFLPVNSEKANLFIKSRKDSYGNVDRSVKMRINFRITGLMDGQTSQEKKLFVNEKYLNAEIVSIDFFKEKSNAYQGLRGWLNSLPLE
ncbi:MAG: DUF4852 domain-containing protein, partial [Flammeovirgaceae bacterium]